MTEANRVPSSSVLVVVDVQNGFVSDESAAVVPRIAALVDRWQRAGGAVVLTRYLNYDGSPFQRLIHWFKLQSAPETDLAPEIACLADQPSTYQVDKGTYTLFNDAGAKLVADHGWTDLLIVGIATESCVLKTAVDAFERDLTPWVLRDAVASHDGVKPHEAGLLVAERFIGLDQVVETTAALSRLGLDIPG